MESTIIIQSYIYIYMYIYNIDHAAYNQKSHLKNIHNYNSSINQKITSEKLTRMFTFNETLSLEST